MPMNKSNNTIKFSTHEWLADKLGNICDYFNGGSHEEFVNYDGDFILISLNSIDIEGNLKKSNKKVSYTDNSLRKDDLVMVLSDVAHGNFLGLSAIIPNDNYVLNQRMAGLRIKNKEKFSPQYLRYYINHNQKYFKSKGQGSSQLNLSKNAVTDFEIYYPKNNEIQQNIATCLSSSDDVIAGHEEKLTALEEHKKGLMQNLFPQEGETQPKYRFPEFENDGDWDIVPFSKYITLFRGSSPRPIVDFQTTDEDAVNWIKIGDTKNAIGYKLQYAEEKITHEGAKRSRPVVNGEIILANSMSYGKAYILEIDGCIYDGWFVLRNYEAFFDKNYLIQLLNSDFSQNQYKKLAAGGIVQNISSEIVYNTELFHTTKEEQQKIATVLSSVDELIVAQQEKIEALKEHKKGLMQGLFPKIES